MHIAHVVMTLHDFHPEVFGLPNKSCLLPQRDGSLIFHFFFKVNDVLM